MVKETSPIVTDPVTIFLRSLIIITIVVAVIVTISQTFYTITAGYRGVVLTFGSPSMISIGEGIHLKIPYAQSVVKMNVQTKKYEADASSASKDLQVVSAKIATNYRLDPDRIPEIYQKLGVSYETSIIQPAEQESVKATTALFTAEELITRREEVRVEIRKLLKEKLEPRGIVVEDVSITNFDFSKSFNDAIESKVTAEQLKLKAERDLERIKVEAQQREATAIGQKNAAISAAQGEAESIRIIQEQLAQSPDYIEYQKVQKWDGKLPTVMSGVTPIIDVAKI
jgi:regulator of protease activity HflC (stomatin/prohibitin superfamily)